jgi:hypothetical protein
MILRKVFVTDPVYSKIKNAAFVANPGTNSKIWILCPTI